MGKMVILLPFDEPWLIYDRTTKESGCGRANSPEKRKHGTCSMKIIITVAWNLLGFCIVGALPKAE
jgi:hypothetical protein